MCRGKSQRNKGVSIVDFNEEGDGLPSTSSVAAGSGRNSSGLCTVPKLDQDTVLLTLRDKLRKLGQRLHEVNLLLQKEVMFVCYEIHSFGCCIFHICMKEGYKL